MAAAPILLSADLVRSDHSGNAARQFAQVAAHRTPELVSAALFLLGGVLLVLAAYGLAGAIDGRGGRLAGIGAALLGVGGLWLAAGRAMYAALLYTISAPGIGHAAAITLLDRVSSSAAYSIFLPLLLALIVGPVLLGLGLWRAHVAPVAVPIVWVVAAVGFQAVEGNKPAEAATFGTMMIALAAIALAVIRRGSIRLGSRDAVAAAALALLVLVTLIGAGVASAGGDGSSSARTFTLLGTPRSETSIMRGVRKPQPGSRFLEYGTLGGADHGSYAIEGVLASPLSIGIELTTATFTLPGGSLVAIGSHPSTDRFSLPLVGGSGTYAGAHGTVTIAPAGKHAERVTVHIA